MKLPEVILKQQHSGNRVMSRAGPTHWVVGKIPPATSFPQIAEGVSEPLLYWAGAGLLGRRMEGRVASTILLHVSLFGSTHCVLFSEIENNTRQNIHETANSFFERINVKSFPVPELNKIIIIKKSCLNFQIPIRHSKPKYLVK